jgi:hypothetical protein
MCEREVEFREALTVLFVRLVAKRGKAMRTPGSALNALEDARPGGVCQSTASACRRSSGAIPSNRRPGQFTREEAEACPAPQRPKVLAVRGEREVGTKVGTKQGLPRFSQKKSKARLASPRPLHHSVADRSQPGKASN